jgi:UDP-hydrolysing UDP-N-acetyl-D-glucosamine 2-epimerase
MKKRIIAVFTGNRAEYGLQFPILRAINKHPDLEYRLLVSGAHLDSNFGNTLEEIKNDGFQIDAEIDIEMSNKSPNATSQAIGSGILSISQALLKIKPDIMLVYADRFEGFAAVIAATQMNIPTAHVEGGDLTEGGALDDSVRHAMTKLSHMHFTTNQQATNRILGMGEEHWRVSTVGFPAIDLISEGQFAQAQEVLSKFNLDSSHPVVLFTQHSVTTEYHQAREQIKLSLAALERIALKGAQVIITYPNNDVGGQEIIEELQKLSLKNIENIKIYKSLGRFFYHGVLALSLNPLMKVVCVGNSSSGLKETPAFKCPAVNIGSRQDGRLRGNNVIDSNYNTDEIFKKIEICLYDKEFRDLCIKSTNPYWMGDAGLKIAKILAETPLNQKLIRKRMTLRGESKDGWYR